MITNVTITNYRGISRAELKGLRQLTVITGANNCGKTSVLEAMALIGQAGLGPVPDTQLLMSVLMGHRLIKGNNLRSLRRDPDRTTELSGNSRTAVIARGENGEYVLAGDDFSPIPMGGSVSGYNVFARSPRVTFVAAPNSPDPSALETTWSLAVKNGYSRTVLDACKAIDSSIVNVQLVLDEFAGPVLYVESEVASGRITAWPVAAGGSGFKRMITLVAQLSGATGLVCVDDPDAFLHPRMFSDLSRLFWGLVRSGAQVVIATHNPELISALAAGINGPPESDEFGVYGLQRDAAGNLTCELRLHGAQAQVPRRLDGIRQLLGLT